MKRILNIIGIFFLSIIVFTGCQNFTEDEMEMSPQTRAQLSSGTHYYWYKGNKIPITINTTKSYILFESSDEANLQLPLLIGIECGKSNFIFPAPVARCNTISGQR